MNRPHLRLVRPGDIEHTSYGSALAGGEPVIRSVPLRCSRCFAPLPVVGHQVDGGLLAAPGHVCARELDAPWLVAALFAAAAVLVFVAWLVRIG